jgi:hypothetical protein
MATATRNAKKPIQTIWYGWVQTYPDPSEPDRQGCSVSVQNDTLAGLIGDIFRHGTYYLSLGYRVTVEKVKESCAACAGSGEIRVWRKGHGWTDKLCPECKGRADFGTIADFDLIPSRQVKIVQD